MANSIQFGQQQAVVSQTNPAAPAVGGGIMGGNYTAGHVGSGMSPVMPDNTIPDFITSLFKERIDAAKTAQMYQGVADVRAGKTLEQIHAEQPWYGNIFGKTNYEIGATVYSANKDVADTLSAATDNMDELEQMEPTQMGQWLNDQASSKMQPNNPLYNMVLQKSLIEQSGPMMEMQMKANYAWKQRNLASAQLATTSSASDLYESTMRQQYQLGKEHPDQPVDTSATQQALRNLLGVSMPSKGQSADSVRNFMNAAFSQFTRAGKWHTVTALQNSPQYQSLPVEDRDRLDKMIDTNYSKWRAEYNSTDDALDAAKILYENEAGVVSGMETIKRMQEKNASFAAQTGSPRPYFSEEDQKDALVKAGMNVAREADRISARMDRLAEKNADKIAKQQADADNLALYSKAFLTGKMGVVKNRSDFDAQTARAVSFELQQKNPVLWVKALANNYISQNTPGFVDDNAKQQIADAAAAASGVAYTDGFGSLYQTWKQMHYAQESGKQAPYGPGLSRAYFGNDMDMKMATFDHYKRGQYADQAAYDLVFGPQAGKAAGSTAATVSAQKDLDTMAAQLSSSGLQSFAAKHPIASQMGAAALMSDSYLNKSARSTLASYLKPYYDHYSKSASWMSPEQIRQTAIQDFKIDGGEVLGKYIVRPLPGQHTTMAATLGVPPDMFAEHFANSMDNLMRKNGVKVDNDSTVMIARMPDDAHGPRVYASVQDSDGNHHDAFLSGKDVSDMIRSEMRKKGQQAYQEGMDRAKYRETQQTNGIPDSAAINRIGPKSAKPLDFNNPPQPYPGIPTWVIPHN